MTAPLASGQLDISTHLHLGMYTVQYSKWRPSLYYACLYHFVDAINDPLEAFVLLQLPCSSEDEIDTLHGYKGDRHKEMPLLIYSLTTCILT